MPFNSVHFFMFFPIVVCLYYMLPCRFRQLLLLVCSYVFYMSWNYRYAVLILFTSLATYAGGRGIAYYLSRSQKGRARNLLILILTGNLLILGFFKYADLCLSSISAVLSFFRPVHLSSPFQFLLPVGISFYTFQALGYVIDVYRQDVPAEKNILRYFLFVSFFPQIVAGPIGRSGSLLPQIASIREKNLWKFENLTGGLVTMLWGYFLKMVIADRIAILVNTVFDHYIQYNSFALLTAAIAFSIQIYCDFLSYSTIAVGAAQVLGIRLTENFNTPYFADSFKDFWRRWHISLSTWFRDYLYIPLGGSRCSKGRKYRNIFITFLVSGLWHGASWHYCIWGCIHGLLQIAEAASLPFRKKWHLFFHTRTNTVTYHIWQRFFTWFLVMLAWIFFRAASIRDAFLYIFRMITRPDPWSVFDGSICSLGLDPRQMSILVISLLLLFLVSLIKYRRGVNVDRFLSTQGIVFRWLFIFMLFFMVFIWGEYGVGFNAQEFIYFRF